jgi:5'-nucleotidase
VRRTRLTLATTTTAAAVLVLLPATATAAPHGPEDVTVQLVAMNDFHGRITDTAGGDSQLLTAPGPDGTYGTTDDVFQEVGGAANVAATVEELKASFHRSTQGPSASFSSVRAT